MTMRVSKMCSTSPIAMARSHEYTSGAKTVPAGEGSSEGLATPSHDGISRDTVVGSEEMGCHKAADEENDTKDLRALEKGGEAISELKAAMRKTLQMKKKESRERYALYLCIRYGINLKLLRRAIEGLYNGAIEILQGVMAQTGWVTTLLTGGPRPSLGGNLDMLV